MTSSFFQIVNPHEAKFVSQYNLKSDVSSPRQGKLVYLSSGEWVAASNSNLPMGFLWDDQKLVPSTTLNYPTSNSNDLTNMLGLKVGVCVKAWTMCDSSYFDSGVTLGNLTHGTRLSCASGGLITTGNGAGMFLGTVSDQYSSARYLVAWDFTVAQEAT